MKKTIRKKATTKAKKNQSTAYRLKCKRSANGLSHFVMYGDLKERETIL